MSAASTFFRRGLHRIFTTIITQVSELPVNLTQVADKIAIIKKAKSNAFYEAASIADLESLRTELRGIMRFRKKATMQSQSPLLLNIMEDAADFHFKPHKAKLEGLDLAHIATGWKACSKRSWPRTPL